MNSAATLDPHYVPTADLDRFAGPEAIPFRTIRRSIPTATLSPETLSLLNDLVDSFGQECADQLRRLESRSARRYCFQSEQWREVLRAEHDQKCGFLRDNATKKRNLQPKSPYGLLDKHWKCAVDLACLVASNYWKAQQKKAYGRLCQRNIFSRLNAAERLACYVLLHRLDHRFFDVLDGKTADFSDLHVEDGSFLTSPYRLCKLVRRIFLSASGKFPVHGTHRCCVFDSDSYSLVKKVASAEQKIQLMTKTPRQRVAIPLGGHSRIRGNVILVRRDDGCFSLHTKMPLKVKERTGLKEDIVVDGVAHTHVTGLDKGVTEVFVDDQGHAYGQGLGKLLLKKAERINQKVAARNRLQALARRTKNPYKRQRILQNNLGLKKWQRQRHREDEELKSLVNHALNQVMAQVPSPALVVEDLPPVMELPEKFSRKTKRMLSYWLRGITKERLEFKAAVFGVRLVYAPPAYTSQVCPQCSYVSRQNRRGDVFHCVCCGHQAQADQKAAESLREVVKNKKIRRYQSLAQIHAIYREAYLQRCAEQGWKVLPESRPKRSPSTEAGTAA